MRWFSHRHRTVERHNYTRLLIYWRMWWRGPLPRLPRPHQSVDVLRSDSANRHILECGTQGWACDPKFELGREFCTMHLTAKFHHPTLIVRKLSCRQTNRQTNTRRWKHVPRSFMLRRWITRRPASADRTARRQFQAGLRGDVRL